MRFTDFILALDKAGWQGVTDAQHTKIYDMWKGMYPVIADLEGSLEELTDDILSLHGGITGEDV